MKQQWLNNSPVGFTPVLVLLTGSFHRLDTVTVNGEHAEISDWEMYHNNTTVLISGEQNTTGHSRTVNIIRTICTDDRERKRGRETETQTLSHWRFRLCLVSCPSLRETPVFRSDFIKDIDFCIWDPVSLIFYILAAICVFSVQCVWQNTRLHSMMVSWSWDELLNKDDVKKTKQTNKKPYSGFDLRRFRQTHRHNHLLDLYLSVLKFEMQRHTHCTVVCMCYEFTISFWYN